MAINLFVLFVMRVYIVKGDAYGDMKETENQGQKEIMFKDLVEKLTALEVRNSFLEKKVTRLQEDVIYSSRRLKTVEVKCNLQQGRKESNLNSESNHSRLDKRLTKDRENYDGIKNNFDILDALKDVDQTGKIENVQAINRSRSFIVEEKFDSTISRRNMGQNLRRGDLGFQTTSIAFSAMLSHNLFNLDDGNIIVFDTIITNEGNSYSHHSGEFTCLHRGLYVFFVTIVTDRSQYIGARIMKNDSPIAHLYTQPSVRYDSGSNLVTVHLSVGDRVWVVLKYAQNGIMLSETFTTFSGFLLN